MNSCTSLRVFAALWQAMRGREQQMNCLDSSDQFLAWANTGRVPTSSG
jgi:hypothetical protein